MCQKNIRLTERSQHELGVVPPDVDLVDFDRLRVRELGLLAQQERADVAEGSVEDAASVDGLDVKKSGNGSIKDGRKKEIRENVKNTLCRPCPTAAT